MSHKIFVQGPGLTRVTLLEVDNQARVADLVRHAREAGVTVEAGDALVTLEDSDEPFAGASLLSDVGLGDKASVHVGRCHRVHVEVRYGSNKKERDFSPAQRIRHVLSWVTGNNGFDFSDTDAQDLVLVIPGAQEPLDLDDHVGMLTHDDRCEVHLDLVASDRIQG